MDKRSLYFLFALPVLMIGAAALTKFPQADINNGLVHARIYLPDATRGYYRGTRFDWSAVMPDLEWNGHRYCAEWFNDYSPVKNDAIMGPVESFSPLGFAAAKPGGSFVQVGVGKLAKMQEAVYNPFSYYPVIDYGTWTIKKQKASITFMHILQDSAYGYEYEKTVALVKDKPAMLLIHTLKNTGQQKIETDVYNHNLFVMDEQATGPGYTVGLPFMITASAEGQRGFGDNGITAISDSLLVFNRRLIKGESAYAVLSGYSSNAKDYDIKIENHTTGAAVKITCDQPLSKLVFWASARIFSPEPYIKLNILPGETFSWTISYTFYNCTVLKED
ncbi:MAG: hypothetical protein ABIQ88_13175 [Chitinophagaceae bacterium]